MSPHESQRGGHPQKEWGEKSSDIAFGPGSDLHSLDMMRTFFNAIDRSLSRDSTSTLPTHAHNELRWKEKKNRGGNLKKA